MNLTILRRRADSLCNFIAQEDTSYTADEAWDEAVASHAAGTTPSTEPAEQTILDRKWAELLELVGQINDAERSQLSCG